MENFNTVPDEGSFGQVVSVVNANFQLAYEELQKIGKRAEQSRGLFPSVAALTTAYPTPKAGEWAYVGNSFPVAIYECVTDGVWKNSGATWNGESVDLTNYALKADTQDLLAKIGYFTAYNQTGNAAISITATGFRLTSGGCMRIKMLNAVSTSTVTLNINSTGAKTLYYNDLPASIENSWSAGEVIEVYYDGTQYKSARAQVKVILDDVPTAGSNNLVKSGGVLSTFNKVYSFTPLYDKYNNIVQKEDITRENGIFIKADGTIDGDAAYGITDYIFIKGCKNLNWHGHLPVVAKSVAAVAFYDENKTFISSVSVGNASSGSTYTTFQTDIIITSIPANAAYVIACTEKNCDEFYLETDVSNIDLLRNQIKNSSELNFDNTVKYCDLKIVKETPGLTSIIHNWGFIGDSLCSGEIAYTFTATPNILHYLDCYPFSYGQRIVKAIGGRGVNYSSGGLTTKAWWQKYIENQNSGWTEDGSSSVFSTNNHSAFIIALGTNDANQQVNAGSISDINLSDYTQNADTFAGNYGKIIQKIREINHRSPIFLIIYPSMLMSDKYDTIIKQLVTLFTGVFLIDLRTDLSLAKIDISPYFFGGHLTTQGYQFFAYVLMNEIDNIIRTNMQYFNKQALIGTSVQNEDIIW